MTDTTELQAGIRRAIAGLAAVPCTFWACEGPDVGHQDMKTCQVCTVIIQLRRLLDPCPEQGIGDHACVEHEEPAEGCFRCGHDPIEDRHAGGCMRCGCSSPFGGLT